MKERTARILIVCMFIIAIVITILFSTPFESWSVEDCPVCDGLGYFECPVCGERYDCSCCE